MAGAQKRQKRPGISGFRELQQEIYYQLFYYYYTIHKVYKKRRTIYLDHGSTENIR